jgi:hypothetical protein
MAGPARVTIPWLTADVEPTSQGAQDAAVQLDAFAARHQVSADVRRGIAAIATDVVEVLGDSSAPMTLEADIDQGNVQVVFTQERESPAAADAAVARLRTVGQGERFDARRSGLAVEAWICFPLREDGLSA